MHALRLKQLRSFVLLLFVGSTLMACGLSETSDTERMVSDKVPTRSISPAGDPFDEPFSDDPMSMKVDDATLLHKLDGSEDDAKSLQGFVFLSLRSDVLLDDLDNPMRTLRFSSNFSADSPVINHERFHCFTQEYGFYRPFLFMDKGMVLSEYGTEDYESVVRTSFQGYPEGSPLNCFWEVDGDVQESEYFELNPEGYDFPAIERVMVAKHEKTGELLIYASVDRDRGNLRMLSIMAEAPGTAFFAEQNLDEPRFEGWINTGQTVPEGTDSISMRLYVFGESNLVTSGHGESVKIQDLRPIDFGDDETVETMK